MRGSVFKWSIRVVGAGTTLASAHGFNVATSLDLNCFNLNVERHFHFEAIPLTDGDAKVRAVERAGCVGTAHVLLRRR